MKRIEQALLIATFLGFSWLAMQAVHELGHVVGAWLTKAEVTKVALHPCIISRTALGHNPHPSAVVWAGPIIGSALPLLALLAARACRFPGIYLYRCFAGVCLIANGIYIAFGPTDGAADTGIMIQHGSSRWIMVAFGLLAAPLGLYCLHRQGQHFGLGNAKGKASRRAAIVSASLFAAIIVTELLINSR